MGLSRYRATRENQQCRNNNRLYYSTESEGNNQCIGVSRSVEDGDSPLKHCPLCYLRFAICGPFGLENYAKANRLVQYITIHFPYEQ